MKLIKMAIHLHTHQSVDSDLSPEELMHVARRERIDCVAITDHDEIDGALRARRCGGGVRVIVGEEVTSLDGHIIGLFIEQRIPPGLSAEQTIRRIREQGGLVLAPHPFARPCASALGKRAMQRLLPHFDAIEVVNAQNPLPWQDRKAARFARRHGLPVFAGADAHLRRQKLAPTYQYMPDFDGPDEFLRSLAHAQLHRGRFGPRYLMRCAFQHVYRKATGRPPRGYGVAALAAG